MKLKTILSIVIAACAAIGMSVAASAATDVKAGTPYTNSKATRLIVPIVVESTDITDLSGYQLNINYGSDYTYSTTANAATYYDEDIEEYQTSGSLSYNEQVTGVLSLAYTTANFLNVDDNNQIALCNVYFSAWPEDYSANDITVSVIKITTGLANAEVNYLVDDCTSFFTFDVTGDLDGNEVVALYASTDDGVTLQPLEYYLSTDYEDGMEYADATTSFLVAVNNTQGATSTANVTIYGELTDGTTFELADYAQDDFLIQTFE